jgi:hypothetical protein
MSADATMLGLGAHARDGTVAPVAIAGINRKHAISDLRSPAGLAVWSSGAIGLGRNGRDFGPLSCDAGRSVTSC